MTRRLLPLRVPGAVRVESVRHRDGRGWLDAVVTPALLGELGLPPIVRVNRTRSDRAGTVRGIHLQAPPFAEHKLVRCTRGRVWDVVVDLRDGSPQHGHWDAVELGEDDDTMVYVPPGCGHAIQALTDDAEVLYLVTAPWAPEHERGVRWDDPSLRIVWPCPVRDVSEKDGGWPLLRPE